MKTILKAKVRPKAIEYRFKNVPVKDIRQALTTGNLHPLTYLMGRVHFFEDETALDNLRRMVMQILVHRAGRSGWQIYSKTCEPKLNAFVELIVIDVLSVYVSNDYNNESRKLSGRDKAKLLGMDESTWRRIWRPRFNMFRENMVEHFDAMIQHVARQTSSGNKKTRKVSVINR